MHNITKMRGKRPESGNRPWFSVRNDGASPEVLIYDEIGIGWFGGGVAPENLIDEIKGLNMKDGETLTVRINSPGGNLFDGNTIYNYLRSIKQEIRVRVDGMAASAASIIAMAGDTVEMPENSFLMIHNPMWLVAGDSRDFRKAADDLDVMRDGAIKTYQSKTSMVYDELKQMLDDETWLSADRSVELGFADEVIDPVKAAALAKFDLGMFGHVPDELNTIRSSIRVKNADLMNKIKERRIILTR